MRKSFIYFTVLATIVLCSCGSVVVRENPNTADEVTADWDIKDINIIAESMLDSLHNHRLAFSEPPKVILVLNVRNKTYEHIDTKAVTDTIITGLLKSGRFKAIAERDMRRAIEEEAEYNEAIGSNDGEIFSLETIQKHRTKVGADLVMYGEIVGIEKRGSRVKDVSYKMTLKLTDIQTTLIEWQDQKDIRKKQKSSFFGS